MLFLWFVNHSQQDKIDPIQVRLTAVTFASEARVEFSLTDCPFSDDLLGAGQPRLQELEDPKGCIGNISFGGVGRDIANAVQTVHMDVISQTRPGVTKLLVLLTTRLAEDMEALTTQANQLRSVDVDTLAIDVSRQEEQDPTADALSRSHSGSVRFGTLQSVSKLHKKLKSLACKVHQKKKKRVKRAWFDHFDKCDETISVDNEPGRTCGKADWVVPEEDDVDIHRGGDPGDCFSEGVSTVEYEFEGTWGLSFLNGDNCKFYISVTVHRCPQLSSTVNFGSFTCKGAEARVYGTVCTYTCYTGYMLRGSSSLECTLNQAWSDPAPYCEVIPPPDLTTCRVAVIDSQGEATNSTTSGSLTHCPNQRNETVNTQPKEVHYVVKTGMSTNFDLPDGEFGVVGTTIVLKKLTVQGVEVQMKEEVVDSIPTCQYDVSVDNPFTGGTEQDCEGTISIPSPSLMDGERLCVDIHARSGGHYGSYNTFESLPNSKRICFLHDTSKPVHCSEKTPTCNSQPLKLSTRLTKVPVVEVRVEGWEDPIPVGGSSETASKIDKYVLEVHKVDINGQRLNVQENAIKDLTVEWEAEQTTTGSVYVRSVSLPAEEPLLYAIILEVLDKAGNVGYSRRLVLYDNSSDVMIKSTASLRVTHANPWSGNKWQTDISQQVCLGWTDLFHNSVMYHTNYLQPVKEDTARDIQSVYDQNSGILPVSGTDNVNGIVRFEMSWSLDGGAMSTFQTVNNLQAQSTCLNEVLSDGQTYSVMIRASDIMDKFKEENVTVSIDYSPPEVEVLGLKGRLDRDVVYVHNDTDLSLMVLLVETADPHSGLRSLHWTLGTRHMADDVGRGAVGVQRLPNDTDCQAQSESCYCPSVGDCELDLYHITFHSLVHNNTHQGQHHRDYHLTVTATNHASLSTTKTLKILLDDSPPSKGVVWEGLGDDPENKAEMDFTSSDEVHVRWHGFLDHESDVLLYRVVLAQLCVTGEKMDGDENATVVERGTAVTLRFPEEGLFYTSVVAYNGAMEASKVACSDGIVFDTSPPRLVNVTITHARTQHMLACSQTDQPWLINSNMTRVRLASTATCLTACSTTPFPDFSHIPVSSEHTLDNDTSDDLCGRLPKMTEDSSIVLPSDYLKLTWEGEDAESEMEDYLVGLGSDRTAATAPDILPFTSTHGHSEYHVRHSGLSHGDVFFIFLRAVSKAGLQADLTLGPVTIDVTPPDVTMPLVARVDADFLVLSWDRQSVNDDEQPNGVKLEVFFRVGHEDGFLTPFLIVNSTSPYSCNTTTSMSDCARYPVSILHTLDTHPGRDFFFQLHVINAAGHAVTVNSSSVSLPALSLPSHAVVEDVIKTLKTSNKLKRASAIPATTDSASTPTVPTTSTGGTTEQTTSDILPDFIIEMTGDVDVILRQQELCVAWSGLVNEDITVEVGIGSDHDQDDVIPFVAAENTGFTCINATLLPTYTKLFSVIQANNSAGMATLASDGFVMIPEIDPDNVIQTFIGHGCTTADVMGEKTLGLLGSDADLDSISDIPLHPGDVLFVEFKPFVPNVVFPDALVLRTTLYGYQVVTKTAHGKVTLPSSASPNTTVTVFKCLKGEPLLLGNHHGDTTVTWEVPGQWESFVQHFKVEILDHTCFETSTEPNALKREQCLVAENTVGSSKRRALFNDMRFYNGHLYVSTVSACFDDSCKTAARSDVVEHITDPKEIAFVKANIVAEVPDSIEIEVEAFETPPASASSSTLGQRCVFLWTVARDTSGSTPVAAWKIGESFDCSSVQVHEQVQVNRTTMGTLYSCIQPVFPWRATNPSCQALHRVPGSGGVLRSLHVVELPVSTFRETDFERYLHSQHLGSKLHELYDLDVDFVRSGTVLSAVVTDGSGRNVTWFMTTNPAVPADGDCESDPSCLVSKKTDTGKVTFPTAVSRLQENTVYFICARVGSKHRVPSQDDVVLEEVCGDGVVIDDSPPVAGTAVIGNAVSAFLGGEHRVLVSWTGFSDVENQVSNLPDDVTINYSVALGSYPGGEDVGGFVQVGQRISHTFDHVHLLSGTSCIATVIAEDRLGHKTEVSSNLVIIDNTPPGVAFVAAGTTTQSNFVAGVELPVHWEGVEDSESGVNSIEVSIASEGGESEFLPFRTVDGSSTILTDTTPLLDGHSYVVLLKATNGAGLTSLASSKPFVVDRSPPGGGVIRSSAFNSSILATYSTDPTSYRVHWSGFTDPHSGLAYYRVGLGSQSATPDIVPFLYVGLQTSYTWQQKVDQGKKYFTLVEACNRANLCRVTSSSSITFDNSPPTAGLITVGFDGHRTRYLGHSSSLPVQWTGFVDPQTGIQEYWWCVGTSPGSCDVIPSTHTMQSRATQRTVMSLPEATPLYVSVRARNPAGLDEVSVSESVVVDTTAPKVIRSPRFLSPRDGSVTSSQWDRSVLHLAFEFSDPGSSVVKQTVYIRSRLTGRLLTEPVHVGSDRELMLTLDDEHLAVDGDSYWATVIACNGASLCTASHSDTLLVDSTPPVIGMLESPLTWTKQIDNVSGNLRTLVNVSCKSFSDPESGMEAYYVTAGRTFDGEELSGGQVKILHDNSTLIQTFNIVLLEELQAGDIVYLSIVAENKAGLRSTILRKSVETFVDDMLGNSGNLALERHSCEAFYCTQECTCASTGQVCDADMPSCQELSPTDPRLAELKVLPYMVVKTSGQSLTTSGKCLEGRWNLSDSSQLSNISRFQWSYSLANTTPGEGVFDTDTEKIWYDVGRNMIAVHCLPATRMLQSQESYVLHVRVWMSKEEYVTFVSGPVYVDHSPPQLRRGHTVTESDASCQADVDFITEEPRVFACWQDVFLDGESEVAKYEIWVGTSPLADDFVKLTDVGLSANHSFSSSAMETGARYYVSVRAWNSAGLQTTAVSDGVSVDSTPPTPGVVFTGGRYTHTHAQFSATSLSASWTGFEDKESGVTSYHVTVYDETGPNSTTPLLPFQDAGVKTSYTFDDFGLEHGHRYSIAVNARDSAGLESLIVWSPPLLVDTTPPEGLTCRSFQLNDTQVMVYEQSSSFHFGTYSAKLSPPAFQEENVVKIEVDASGLHPAAEGYVQVEETKRPLIFKRSQNEVAVAKHEFILSPDADSTVSVIVRANPETIITVTLFVCEDFDYSDEGAVSIQHMSEYSVSVCSRVRDKESGIKSLKVGLGTTPGGLQVQPLTSVGHSGHFELTTHVQHNMPVYAVVVAENHAGQLSRFISRSIRSDHTPPIVSEVKVKVRYPDESPGNTSSVQVEAEWTAEDTESGVNSCNCHLEGQETEGASLKSTSDVTPGRCLWPLQNPRHGAQIRVSVVCENGVQIQKEVISRPLVVLLRPPNMTQVHISSLSNNAFASPYEDYDTLTRSANSSLNFHWHSTDDPTLAQLQYRFLLESRPLGEWSPLHVYKSSVVLERKALRAGEAMVTVQLRGSNERQMVSEVVSASVPLDDSRPVLTGKKVQATVTETNGEREIVLNWQDVFRLTNDVIYSVYAGTDVGYGNVINHVTTKEAKYTGWIPNSVSVVYVTVQAIYGNGIFEIYTDSLRV
ncbi:hypothetical protein V1264_020121 [Littorina saxatilis]|uniref:Uncharacterized protein n=1 Tax=Littorina saxatilis TaxID=31220 RepID=A0AAN9GBR2_9CAEN